MRWIWIGRTEERVDSPRRSSTGIIDGERRSRAAAVAGEACARCRGSRDTGKARGDSARRGELEGGLRACREGSDQRRSADGGDPSDGELRWEARARFAASLHTGEVRGDAHDCWECRERNQRSRRDRTSPESEERRGG